MHIYKVTIYKLIQHYAHVRVQKLLCRQATLLAATTIIRDVQHHGPKHHFCGLPILLRPPPHTHMHVRVHMHTHAHACTHAHPHMHTHPHTCMHARTHTLSLCARELQALQHRVCLCHSHELTGVVSCTVKSGGLVGYLICI